jgi:predicted  nucleic acid-binding Zn ribbon protein
MKLLDYAHLKPPKPTPKREICKCKKRKAIKLMASCLWYNPIHCIDCNLEVLPESINLDQKLIQEVVYWSRIYGAVDRLWLDSNSYEEWAKAELADINSRINKMGLSANRSMNKFQKCYYRHFQDESDDNYIPFEKCPKCRRNLEDYNGGIFLQKICEKCLIIGSGE